jgi:hypothetical protein
MKLNDAEERMLVSCAQSPRKSQYFSHGNNLPQHPKVVANNLKRLVKLGLLYEEDGVYSITVAGRQSLDTKNDATPREKQFSGTYHIGDGDPYKQYSRPGSDHSNITSRTAFK